MGDIEVFWNTPIEDGITAADILRMLLAMAAGNGMFPPGPGLFNSKSQDSVKDRLVGSIDVDGVRTITTVDGTE